MALHPAENRGYRELMLTAEEARTRLRRIAGHLDLEHSALHAVSPPASVSASVSTLTRKCAT